LPECKFVEFAGKKEYKCPKCKKEIRYAKFFGSDGKILTTDGEEPNGKFGRDSNTGWPANLDKTMHECHGQNVIPDSNTILSSPTKPFTELYVNELKIEDLPMGNRKKEVLFECAVLWNEEIWITDYLKSHGGESPNPAKVGMWHKLITERLARAHEPS